MNVARPLSIALLFLLSSLTAITVATAAPPNPSAENIQDCVESQPTMFDNCGGLTGCLTEGSPGPLQPVEGCSDEVPTGCGPPVDPAQCAQVDDIATACAPDAILLAPSGCADALGLGMVPFDCTDDPIGSDCQDLLDNACPPEATASFPACLPGAPCDDTEDPEVPSCMSIIQGVLDEVCGIASEDEFATCAELLASLAPPASCMVPAVATQAQECLEALTGGPVPPCDATDETSAPDDDCVGGGAGVCTEPSGTGSDPLWVQLCALAIALGGTLTDSDKDDDDRADTAAVILPVAVAPDMINEGILGNGNALGDCPEGTEPIGDDGFFFGAFFCVGAPTYVQLDFFYTPDGSTPPYDPQDSDFDYAINAMLYDPTSGQYLDNTNAQTSRAIRFTDHYEGRAGYYAVYRVEADNPQMGPESPNDATTSINGDLDHYGQCLAGARISSVELCTSAVRVDLDLTPGAGTACTDPCMDNSIAESSALPTRLLIDFTPAQVLDGSGNWNQCTVTVNGICAGLKTVMAYPFDPYATDGAGKGLVIEEINVKQAGPGDSDPARYYLYSDVDDDGDSDRSEINCGSNLFDRGTCSDLDGDGLANTAESLADTDADGVANRYDRDSDGDGIEDGKEVAGTYDPYPANPGNPLYPSNPLLKDTDGDSFEDKVELEQFADPSDAGNQPGDSDADGFPDLCELLAGGDADQPTVHVLTDLGAASNPARAAALAGDVDNDGLTNGLECSRGGHIYKDDRDGDGLFDLYETQIFTSPNAVSTDGDGLSDSVEVRTGIVGADPLGGSVQRVSAWGTTPYVVDFGVNPVVPTLLTSLYGSVYTVGATTTLATTNADLYTIVRTTTVYTTDPVSDTTASSDAGATSALDRDSDDDGLFDHEELNGFWDRFGSGSALGMPMTYTGSTNAVLPTQRFFTRTSPTATDTDLDGLTDAQEVKDTDNPTDCHAVGVTNHADSGSGNHLAHRCDGGHQNNAPRTTGTLTGAVSAIDADSDNDGLTDTEEIQNTWNIFTQANADNVQVLVPTFVNDGDTDDDGLLDGEEIKDKDLTNGICTGTSKTSPGACAVQSFNSQPRDLVGAVGAGMVNDANDSDNDGLKDCQEVRHKAGVDAATCPRLPTVGGDGGWATIPRDSDTDNDGLRDGEEVAGKWLGFGDLLAEAATAHSFPATSPTLSDSDGEGLSDGQEVLDSDGPTACERDDLSDFNAGFGPELRPIFDVDDFVDASCDGGFGTNPMLADTDGDLLDDKVEITGSDNDAFANEPTRPTAADTDSDGLNDKIEVTGSANTAFGNAATNPNVLDTDEDDFSDGCEINGGKNPNDPDSVPLLCDLDGDGLDDAWEVGYFGSTAAQSGSGDFDGDGLSNQDEQTAGTDPTDKDSDDDGLEDGPEVHTYETNPTSEDTDLDGSSDGDEVVAETDPTSPASNPTSKALLLLAEALSIPDPAQVLDNPDCDFTQPIGLNQPGWANDADDEATWDHEACNDTSLYAYLVTVLELEGEVQGTAQGIANDVLEEVGEADLQGTAAAVVGAVTSAAGQTVGIVQDLLADNPALALGDQNDVRDTDGDGDSSEANGQIDLVEANYVYLDPDEASGPTSGFQGRGGLTVYILDSNLSPFDPPAGPLVAIRVGDVAATLGIEAFVLYSYATGDVVCVYTNGANSVAVDETNALAGACTDSGGPGEPDPCGTAPGNPACPPPEPPCDVLQPTTCATPPCDPNTDECTEEVTAAIETINNTADGIASDILGVLCDVSSDGLPGCGPPACDPETEVCPDPEPCDPESDPTCDPEATLGGLTAAVCGVVPCDDAPTDFPPCSEPRGEIEPVRICRDSDGGSVTNVTNTVTGDDTSLYLEIGNLRFQL